MGAFRIEYDDQPHDIVDKISTALKPHGLVIKESELDCDGYVNYTIIRDKKLLEL